jgi:4-aminobutyrate---pyruvate transaminase
LAGIPWFGETRGIGLLGAVGLVRDKSTGAPFEPSAQVGMLAGEFAQQEGLILRAIGDFLALCPPLIISEPELHEMFDKLTRALDRTEHTLRR